MNDIIDAVKREDRPQQEIVPKRIIIDVGNNNLQTNFDKEETIKILEDAARYLRGQKEPIEYVKLEEKKK